MRINVSVWSVALAEVFMCFSGVLCAYGEPVKVFYVEYFLD